jgi:hypothetical protein
VAGPLEYRAVLRVFTRATAVLKMNTSTVFGVERSILQIQAWPAVLLQVSIHVHCLMLLSVPLVNNIVMRELSSYSSPACR